MNTPKSKALPTTELKPDRPPAFQSGPPVPKELRRPTVDRRIAHMAFLTVYAEELGIPKFLG